MLKLCTDCKQEKDISNFSKNPSKKDGLNYICRACHKIRRRQHYIDNQAKYIAMAAARNKIIRDTQPKKIRDKIFEDKKTQHKAYRLVKSLQLGMSYSNARSKLTKLLLYDFSKRLNIDICFVCSKKIETITEFSIEHKIPWLYSKKPINLFFDINNIAFSHLRCNSSRKRKSLTC
jgi:hypothetical protein